MELDRSLFYIVKKSERWGKYGEIFGHIRSIKEARLYF